MQPCDWEVIGCDDCEALTSLDDEIRTMIEERAATRLWEWTNRRFGMCPMSYRPCKPRCAQGSYMWSYPMGQGSFINLSCGRCGDSCSCGSVSEVILPGPIAEPVEILVDGVELDIDTSVVVYNYNRLTRIDGGKFPTCQDLSKPPTEVGTWQITYLQGEPVPPGGQLVAGILACEYAKAMCGDDSCRLPKRVSSITRQGITMAMLDDFDRLSLGMTGIWEIDDWVTTYSTNLRMGPWQASTVSSPDLTPRRLLTWSAMGS